MIRLSFLLLLSLFLLYMGGPVHAQNPFMSKKSPEGVSQSQPSQHPFLYKTALWQQQLKQKMAMLVRQARTEDRSGPLMIVLLIAFAYGTLHAAGPGHGKAVAMTFMLSQNASPVGGLLFGVFIALFHGFSGIFCVLALRYIVQEGISENLGSVSHVTQLVSFSLIALLGLAIALKNGYGLLAGTNGQKDQTDGRSRPFQKHLVAWALAVGLVPCPGVIMVLLFCLSMDALTLGLLLAVVISLGMATTISFVIVAVVLGKGFSMRLFSSEKRRMVIERSVGLASGTAVAALGALFLISMLV